jgi:hypothetical protein
MTGPVLAISTRTELERCNPSQQTSDGDSRVKPGYDGVWQRVQYVNGKGGWHHAPNRSFCHGGMNGR